MVKRTPASLSSLIPLRYGDAAPLYQQIYNGLRQAILSGQLLPGTRIPASRVLARELKISRTTVIQAYQQLLAEGYLGGRPGSGTFVAQGLPEEGITSFKRSPGAQEREQRAIPLLSERGNVLLEAAQATTPFFVTGPQAGSAFRVGLPALDAFPHELWGRLLSRRFRSSWLELLAPHEPGGYQPLREAIAAHLGTTRGVRCTAEQVIIVAGSQQGLDLIARVLLNPGDAVWVEDPGYLGARTALLGVDARPIPVPVDQEGFDLAAGLARCAEARLAYITPSHQFPLGMTMSVSRRLALLEWARRANGWIVEDDYDSEFRYVGRPLSALQGLDEHGRVLYLGTFSKVLSPALRLGYLVARPDLVEPLLAARANADMHSPMLEQAVLADFMAQGHFARHLRRMRHLYAARQAAMLAEARQALAGLIELSADETGLHLVGWLPDGLDDRLLARRAADVGVVAYPLSLFQQETAARKAVLLGYAAVSVPEIRDGVRKLASVCRAMLNHSN